MEEDFGKMVESMPALPVTAPPVRAAARRNEPDDENESDQPKAQPHRSGCSAVAVKPAATKRSSPTKRSKGKRAAA